MRKMSIGLQLFTMREQLAADFEGTLRKVAELGYEGVEFYTYGNFSAKDMKALLDELGLKAIGSHIQLQALKDNLQAEIEYLKVIGAKYAICPWLPLEIRDEESWKQHLVDFAEVARVCSEKDITFLYHNHDFEFTTKLDGKPVFEVLFDSISPEHLKVEMDIGWVQYAGIEPVSYIHKYAGRLPLLHLKDYLKVSRDPEKSIDTVELGQGDLPLLNIIQAASDASVEWIIVEQDSCVNSPFECIATSLQWLKDNYLFQIK